MSPDIHSNLLAIGAEFEEKHNPRHIKQATRRVEDSPQRAPIRDRARRHNAEVESKSHRGQIAVNLVKTSYNVSEKPWR